MPVQYASLFIANFPEKKAYMNSIDPHAFYMNRCIELGLLAKQRGDSPVGSVLVADGVIVSEGIEGGKTHRDITYHAEIEAIRNLVKSTGLTDLSHCILYTTHEPCIMCSYVIRHHKINTVVWAISTGVYGGGSSDYKLLEDRSVHTWATPPLLISGVMEQACMDRLYSNS